MKRHENPGRFCAFSGKIHRTLKRLPSSCCGQMAFHTNTDSSTQIRWPYFWIAFSRRGAKGVAAVKPAPAALFRNTHESKNRRKPTSHMGCVFLLWTLPRAKNCSPALNFCTSVRTGAALSSPSFRRTKKEEAHRASSFLVRRKGLVCIFALRAKIKVLPPSSRRQATVHRIVAFDCSSPFLNIKIKQDIPDGISCLMVRRKGLEPPTY